MRKETVERLERYYDQQVKLSEKYIGSKKANFQVNNFLFLPTEDHLEILGKVYNLQAEDLKLIRKVAEESLHSFKTQIKELIEILCLEDYNFNAEGFLTNFFTNKFIYDMEDALFIKSRMRDWIANWGLKEFVMPFFICSVLKSERKKALPYIIEVEKNKWKKSFNGSAIHPDLEKLVRRIRKAKEEIVKTHPEKKVSISAVAKKLNIKDSTFRDKLKDVKKHNGLEFKDM